MIPTVAEAIDPIFLSLLPVLELLGAVDSKVAADGAPLLTASEIRRRLEDRLQQADRLLASEGKDWRDFSKYALIAWIDEMLGMAHEWPGKREWTENALEFRTFGTHESNEEFYKRASRAPGESSADATEMYYVCVLLGFVGLYRNPNSEEGRSQIGRLGLRPDLRSWVDDYGQIVKQTRGLRGQTATGRPDRVISPATPHWSRASLIWPALLSVICAGVSVLAWWGRWS